MVPIRNRIESVFRRPALRDGEKRVVPVARLCITLIPFPAQLGAERLQAPTPPPDHAWAFELALLGLADDLDVSPRRVRSGVKTFIEAITQQCIPLSIMREHFARVEGTGSGSQA